MINKNSTREEVLKECWEVQYAIDKLKNDRDVVLEAVRRDDWVLKYASKQLQRYTERKEGK